MIEVITTIERKENWPVHTYTHENLHTISGYQEMVQMTIINKHHCISCIILVITKRDTSNLTQAVHILKICVVIMTMNSHVKNSNYKKSLAYRESDRLLGMEIFIISILILFYIIYLGLVI